MTRLWLIRHGACEGLGERLNGRAAGSSLTAEGREGVKQLGRYLARQPVRAIWTSPRERCLQTADLLAGALRRNIEIKNDLDEVDFGDWTGKNFAELEGDAAWRRWNEKRSEAQAPAGEDMAAVQLRMRRALAQGAALGGDIALVSHAEPVRAAVAEILGFSLDNWARLAISPASVTEIIAGPQGFGVASVNQTVL